MIAALCSQMRGTLIIRPRNFEVSAIFEILFYVMAFFEVHADRLSIIRTAIARLGVFRPWTSALLSVMQVHVPLRQHPQSAV